MARSQALRLVWWNFVRKMITGLFPILGLLVGFYVATEFLDYGLEESMGVAFVVGAVFFVIGLFLRRFVPKPGTAGGAAGAVGAVGAAGSAVSDLLDD